MARVGSHQSYTSKQAYAWRGEYDTDATLRVVDMAKRHRVDPAVMRSALLWAGGALRVSAVTSAARRAAGLK